MNLSLEFLDRCSAETGFQVAALEKVFRIGEIAGNIARHPMLGEVLALKGGTALNLCFGPPTRLSVDLDFNFRIPFSGTVMQQLWQPDALDQPGIRVVGVSELLIGKFLALLDRGAARDVWDVANLPKALQEVARSRDCRCHFIAFSATLLHPLTTYSQSRLEKLATNQILTDQLIPMLIKNKAIDLRTLVPRAWDAVSNFIQVDRNEAEYIASIERGEIRMDLLFPEKAEKAGFVARHPAIQWKIKNVRERLMRN